MRASERDPHGPAIADFFQKAKLLLVNVLIKLCLTENSSQQIDPRLVVANALVGAGCKSRCFNGGFAQTCSTQICMLKNRRNEAALPILYLNQIARADPALVSGRGWRVNEIAASLRSSQ
jgi:hypothetical protein